jgi:RimJ/RimL family protein N-acetyltransferase
MEYSLVESRRFGLRVFRAGLLAELDAASLRRELLDNRADVLIFRLPAEQQAEVRRLNDVGFEFIVADVQISYAANLRKHAVRERRLAGLTFELCTAADFAALDETVSAAFSGYAGHYHANPHFKQEDILEGYKEWARTFLAPEGAARGAWLGKRRGRPVGVVALAFEGDTCEAVLAGVVPAARDGGVILDCVRFVHALARERGCRRIVAPVLVKNYAMQKALIREGFEPASAWLTVHVNSLLSRNAPSPP